MFGRTIVTVQLGLAAIDVYLIALLAAAAGAKRDDAGGTPRREESRVAVLIPAHDEAAGIGECVDAVNEADAQHVIVVADNCTDDTAAVARAHGATVLERHDPEHRGKGHALNWALSRLGELGVDADAIAFVDADCTVSPNFIHEVRRTLAAGAVAVQVPYVVANPGASAATALRRAAFALMNIVRPLGRSRLGLSAGVLGTGMAFERGLIQRYRFDTDSLVEDADLHLRLVLDGHRVAFAPAATVSSPMPTGAEAVHAQQSRWEGGRWDLIKRFAGPLLRRTVTRRDPAALSAVAELMVPPTTLLALAHAGVLVASVPFGGRAAGAAAGVNAMHAAFVIGGLKLAGEPRETYVALLEAPALVLQKLRVFGDMAVRGAPSSWERTAREPAPSA